MAAVAGFGKARVDAQTGGFDLEFLEYLSSAGLRVILGAAKEMKRRDGKFVLCALNAYVKEVFEVSGFGAIIPIAESVEAGIKEIG